MNPTNDNPDDPGRADGIDEKAATAFLRGLDRDRTARDLADLDAWLDDTASAEAYKKAADAWQILGKHAKSPEVIAFRQDALGSTLGSGAKRSPTRIFASHWSWAAGVAAVAIVTIGLVQVLFRDEVSEIAYETGIGEQRMVELEDRSKIVLDALTTLQVRMTRDSRVIELTQGQALFNVASDPRRPFRVEAGAHSVTAVGTSFNVEYLDRQMQVAMVEGKVAVSIATPSASVNGEADRRIPFEGARRTFDLVAGQALRVAADGQSHLVLKADIAAATAWRQGMLVFTETLLIDAVRDLNRYSRMQIKLGDPSLALLRISGVFESGNTEAFLEAAQSFLPISAYQTSPDEVLLSPGPEPDLPKEDR